jgi:hypothetical protein
MTLPVFDPNLVQVRWNPRGPKGERYLSIDLNHGRDGSIGRITEVVGSGQDGGEGGYVVTPKIDAQARVFMDTLQRAKPVVDAVANQSDQFEPDRVRDGSYSIDLQRWGRGIHDEDSGELIGQERVRVLAGGPMSDAPAAVRDVLSAAATLRQQVFGGWR